MTSGGRSGYDTPQKTQPEAQGEDCADTPYITPPLSLSLSSAIFGTLMHHVPPSHPTLPHPRPLRQTLKCHDTPLTQTHHQLESYHKPPPVKLSQEKSQKSADVCMHAVCVCVYIYIYLYVFICVHKDLQQPEDAA